jgi:ribosomal-protein-alanine N-acetyltransferase
MSQAEQNRAERCRTSYSLMPMNETHAIDIAAWRYPAPFERYNHKPWAEQKAEGRELADPAVRSQQYRSILQEGQLYGYVQWFPLAAEDGPDIVRLGLGVRPDACGRGCGASFVAFVARETASRHPRRRIDLEVAADNPRAIRAYERAGFQVVDAYDLPCPRQGDAIPTLNMLWLPDPDTADDKFPPNP